MTPSLFYHGKMTTSEQNLVKEFKIYSKYSTSHFSELYYNNASDANQKYTACSIYQVTEFLVVNTCVRFGRLLLDRQLISRSDTILGTFCRDSLRAQRCQTLITLLFEDC